MGRQDDYNETFSAGVAAEREIWVRMFQDKVTEMQKKDYEMIARILRTHKPMKGSPIAEQYLWLHIMVHFENELAKDNPNFSRSQFLEACNAVGKTTAKFLKLTEKSEKSK